MPRKNNSELDPNIGDRLRMRRLMLGMGQEALSEELSLTFQQIQKYQKGTNWVSASRLYELAQALDVPVQYFFDGICYSLVFFIYDKTELFHAHLFELVVVGIGFCDFCEAHTQK